MRGIAIVDTALLITCSASLVLNIFLLGILTRWMRYAKTWQEKYEDAIANVPPVQIKTLREAEIETGYNWGEDWA